MQGHDPIVVGDALAQREQAGSQLSLAEQVYAIRTWRYLRLTMIVVVLGLGVAVGYERSRTDPGCFQHSISAYYYTPVRAVFVGALVVIGACLVCLRGSSKAEDVLLNLAGMFAPVVAFVPTPHPGSCASVLATTQGRDVNVANNFFALLVVGALGLFILLVLVLRTVRRGRRLAVIDYTWYAASAAVWALAALVFGLARGFFLRNAHYTAAVAMFVCILAVAVINACAPAASARVAKAKPVYRAIAGAMVLAAIVVGIAGKLGWDYWVLGMEISLISLFAIFWATQTIELWHDGLRPSAAIVGRG